MTLSKLSIKAQRIPIPRLHGLPLGIIKKSQYQRQTALYIKMNSVHAEGHFIFYSGGCLFCVSVKSQFSVAIE